MTNPALDYRSLKPVYALVEIDNDFKLECEKADADEITHFAEKDPKRPTKLPVLKWVAKYRTCERTWRWGGLSYPIYTLVETLENPTGTIKSHTLYRRMSMSQHKTIVSAWEAGVWPTLVTLRKAIKEDLADWMEDIGVPMPHDLERQRRRAMETESFDRDREIARGTVRMGPSYNFDGGPSMPIRGADNQVVGRITPRGGYGYSGCGYPHYDDDFARRWEDTFRSAGKARCPRSRPTNSIS